MPYVIGVDEAGYGPNLGPLLISASVWRIPADWACARESVWPGETLYDRLASAVDRQPAAASSRGARGRCNADDDRLIIADSKALYQPKSGLTALEENFLAAASDPSPPDWLAAWRMFATESVAALQALPWYQDYQPPLPRAGCVARIDRLRAAWRCGLSASGVRLTAVRSRALFAGQFNQETDRWGNKAAALTRCTLQLVQQLVEELPADDAVWVHCDKHGGRNRYQPHLQETFPDSLVLVVEEGARQSRYRCRHGGRPIEIRFVAQGEGYLPAALASMACKYLRELAMESLNAFWSRHVADLKPTAGYPVDARRFLRDIEPARQRLRIDAEHLWRKR